MKSSIRLACALSVGGIVVWFAWRPIDVAGDMRAAQRDEEAGSRNQPVEEVLSAEPNALCQQPATAGPLEYDPALIRPLVDEARARGNSRRGAMLFGSPHFACISCHRVGQQGGGTGPELTTIGKTQTPEQIVESLLWPKRLVKPEFMAHLVVTTDGKQHQGYKESETPEELVLRDPAMGGQDRIRIADIEERREVGTLMPEGLATAMTAGERRDIVRFLTDLGHDSRGWRDWSALRFFTRRRRVFPTTTSRCIPNNGPTGRI